MDAQLKKGLLEVCVLAAIREEESYGYKIVSEIAPYIEISESTLYPILRRLEASGAVSTRRCEACGRLRRYYKITKIGIKRIEDFRKTMAEFQRIGDFISKGDKE